MPIATLSPYAADQVFSRSHPEELTLILDSIRTLIRSELAGQELWRVNRLNITRVFYDKDLAVYVGGNDTSISRWKNKAARPPDDVINYLRKVHREVEDAPAKGAHALMDYVRRKEKAEGLSHDPAPPPSFDSWKGFEQAVGDWELTLGPTAQVIVKTYERSDAETATRLHKGAVDLEKVRHQIGAHYEKDLTVFQRRLGADADGENGALGGDGEPELSENGLDIYQLIVTSESHVIESLSVDPEGSVASGPAAAEKYAVDSD
jgi:hypothetical protein